MSELGYVHLVAAWFALVLGLTNQLRRKGMLPHRVVGYLFVTSMLVLNLSALCLYRLTGRFNLFHILAVASLATTAAGVVFAIQRKPGWVLAHARWMQGNYVGLCAASANEIVTRVVRIWAPAMSIGEFWVISVAVTVLVSVIGIGLAQRPRLCPFPRVRPWGWTRSGS